MTAGQYVAIAMMVNAPAVSWDMPLRSDTFEVIESNEPPGSNSIGHTDWPNAVVLAGWLYETPAFVRAARNVLPIMSARMGAADIAAAIATPTVTARNRRAACTCGAQITVTTVLGKSHIYNTVR
jgi:hypothetical protein